MHVNFKLVEREKGPMQTFLTRTRFPWILISILVVIVGFRALDDAINPPDLNQIVLINESGRPNILFPLEVTMATDTKVWRRTFEQGRLLENGGICVLRWDEPFFSGTLEIRDNDNAVILMQDLRPPARYSGALVVLLSEEGKSASAFNRLPEWSGTLTRSVR